MRMPIYTDMDNVLIAPVLDPVTKEPIDIIVRPGLNQFLERLAVYGDLNLLTSANFSWAREGLQRMGPVVRLFKQVITREDLLPILQQMDVVEKADVSAAEREDLYRYIQPIYPPGVIFDDFPVDSWMYRLKGFATGIVHLNPHLWIQVEEFRADGADRGGLDKAYQEFKKRNAAWRAHSDMGSVRKGWPKSA